MDTKNPGKEQGVYILISTVNRLYLEQVVL